MQSVLPVGVPVFVQTISKAPTAKLPMSPETLLPAVCWVKIASAVLANQVFAVTACWLNTLPSVVLFEIPTEVSLVESSPQTMMTTEGVSPKPLTVWVALARDWSRVKLPTATVAVVEEDVLRVPRDVEHLDIRPQELQSPGQLAAVHRGHREVRHEHVDRSVVAPRQLQHQHRRLVLD